MKVESWDRSVCSAFWEVRKAQLKTPGTSATLTDFATFPHPGFFNFAAEVMQTVLRRHRGLASPVSYMTLARSRTGKPNSGDGFVLQSGQLKKWQLNSRWLANKIDLLELKAKNKHVDLIIHSLNQVDGPTSQVIDICNFLN